jgi:hypothetical protein
MAEVDQPRVGQVLLGLAPLRAQFVDLAGRHPGEARQHRHRDDE